MTVNFVVPPLIFLIMEQKRDLNYLCVSELVHRLLPVIRIIPGAWPLIKS